MTKSELIAAIAAAPDDTPVFIDAGAGLLRSEIRVVVEGAEIVLSFPELDEQPDD